jgi:DNA-binding SARP family transcriptional activator/TolB-like protein
MGLLWPDCDEASARHLLSDSLYVLRKDLGEDVVLGSGELLRLNPEVIQCDVWSFEGALTREDLEEAAEVYSGPFLDGFYLGSEGGFEHWVETERQRLAERYAKVLESLAERAEATSDWPRAVEWWKRLIAFDPYNSRVAFRLMEAMAQAGDRANAFQYFQEHERLLRDEFGMETDADLVALAEKLRHEPAPVSEAVDEPVRSIERPDTAASAGSTREPARAQVAAGGLGRLIYHGIRRRSSLIRLAVIALVVSVSVAAVYLALGGRIQRPLADTGAVDPANRVAVLPFLYRGGEEYTYLGEGMIDLLSAKLDGAGELRSVNPQAVLGILAQESGGSSDFERARIVASKLGAGRYVFGDVLEVSGRLRITARLFDSTAGLEEVVRASVEGEAGKFFELVDDLAAQLFVGPQGGPAGHIVQVASLTTDSLAALKVYLKGQIELRAGRFDSAIPWFQSAIEIDSSFALAYYGLSGAASWGAVELAHEAAEKAVRHSSRLPWRERRILEASRAFLLGAAGESERIYREVLSMYPHDVEAMSGLGVVLEFCNALNGRSVGEARGPLQRALSYQPDRFELLYTLARVEASTGNWSAADSLLRRAYPDRPVHFYFRAILAFAGDDPASQQQVLADANEVPLGPLVGAATSVATMVPDLRAALHLARLAARRTESPAIRAFAYLHAAQLEQGLGRPSAAKAEVARAAEFDPASALEYEILWSLEPFLPTGRARLEELRDSLVHWKPDEVSPDSAFQEGGFATHVRAQHEHIHPHLRVYLLGRLSTRLGEHDAALQYAAQLESMAAEPKARTLARDLAQAIRARVFSDRGSPEEALEALEAAPRHVDVSRWWFSSFYTAPQERYLRAGLLAELGRHEEALRWYETLGQRAMGPMYLAPSHLRQAEIYERLGEREKAVHHYERFIELWKDSDPELQPRVEEARRAIDALLPGS